MRRTHLLILAAAAALACTPANAAPASPDLSVRVAAAGDTAIVTVNWSVGRRATGYLVNATTSLTSGTWAFNPVAVGTALGHAIATRTLTFRAVNATADSGDFTVCVRSTRGVEQAPTPTCAAAARWVRPPLSPDTVTVAPIVVGAAIIPPASTLDLTTADTLCAVKLFASGHAALRASDTGPCAAAYATLPATMRAVTAAEQAHENAQCWAWSSSAPTKVPVSALGSCRASARIDGLQLTSRTSADLLHYVTHDMPGATIDAQGIITCWRPGPWTFSAVVEGVASNPVTITCRDPASTAIAAAR